MSTVSKNFSDMKKLYSYIENMGARHEGLMKVDGDYAITVYGGNKQTNFQYTLVASTIEELIKNISAIKNAV
jgi:hypothetical protein